MFYYSFGLEKVAVRFSFKSFFQAEITLWSLGTLRLDENIAFWGSFLLKNASNQSIRIYVISANLISLFDVQYWFRKPFRPNWWGRNASKTTQKPFRPHFGHVNIQENVTKSILSLEFLHFSWVTWGHFPISAKAEIDSKRPKIACNAFYYSFGLEKVAVRFSFKSFFQAEIALWSLGTLRIDENIAFWESFYSKTFQIQVSGFTSSRPTL